MRRLQPAARRSSQRKPATVGSFRQFVNCVGLENEHPKGAKNPIPNRCFRGPQESNHTRQPSHDAPQACRHNEIFRGGQILTSYGHECAPPGACGIKRNPQQLAGQNAETEQLGAAPSCSKYEGRVWREEACTDANVWQRDVNRRDVDIGAAIGSIRGSTKGFKEGFSGPQWNDPRVASSIGKGDGDEYRWWRLA